jgi:maltose O-acetyltransferase
MTEKDKMLSGEYYNCRDEELLEMYHGARKLIKKYNNLESTEINQRNEVLSELLGYKGQNIWIESPFYCDYGENIFIGDNTFININCIFLDDNTITIGRNGLIAPYVQIYTASHPLKAEERILGDETVETNRAKYLTNSYPVIIGNNAWIGGNTVIMPGVTIGNNVVVGAGSVVTKDLPDDVLAYGNPCKVIKEIS